MMGSSPPACVPLRAPGGKPLPSNLLLAQLGLSAKAEGPRALCEACKAR